MNIKRNFNLKNYNTFRINVFTSFYSEVSNITEIDEVINFAKSESLEIFILSGGSNVLFTDDFKGIVVRYIKEGISLKEENNNSVILEVEAGTEWDDFVNYCVKNNYYGVENLSLIPGKIGASPIQNIGAYGVELKDVFYSLDFYSFEEQKVVTFNSNQCNFGYRYSIFKDKFKNIGIIIKVRFELSKLPAYNLNYRELKDYFQNDKSVSIDKVRSKIIEIRRAKLPDYNEYGNAGSFFKNPEIDENIFNEIKEKFPNIVYFELGNNKYKLSAGWLIENCGLKGIKVGNVGTFKRQSLIIINYGEATGQDIKNFSEKIKQDVNKKFGIKLETEVNIIGN